MSKPNKTYRLAVRRQMLLLAYVAVLAVSFLASFNFGDNKAYAVPSTLNFQARLMNAAGAIAPDGDYNVEFKIYNASTSSGSSQGSCTGDSNCLWTETRTSGNKIHVANGYLTANLGSVTAFSGINWGDDLWLTMNVGGTGSPTWDGEMSPRLKLTAVPFAFSTSQLAAGSGANTTVLNGGTPSGNNTISLPAETGTLCIQNSSNCGFLTTGGGGGSFIVNGTTLQNGANFNIQSSAAGSVGGAIRGATSQTANLFQLQDSSGNINAAFSALGNQLTLGRIAGSGTVTAGSLLFADGTTDGFGATLNTTTLTNNRTISLPDEAGTVCLQNSSNCGFLTTGGSGQFVQFAPNSAQADTSTNNSIFINKTGASGNIIRLQNNGTDKFLVSNAGNLGLATSSAPNVLTVNTAATADGAAQALLATGGSSNKGLVIQGAASQTADLLQLQDSAGSVLGRFTAAGHLGLNDSASTSQLSIVTDSTSTIGAIIQGASGQTAELLRLQGVNNVLFAQYDANANLASYGANGSFLNLAVPVFTTSPTGTNYYYVITAVNAQGETVASASLGMTNNTSTVQWSQVTGATGYKIYRNTSNSFTSGSLLLTTITNGATVSYADSGSATSAGLPPTAPNGSSLIAKGWAGQATNIFQVQNSGGTNVLGVDTTKVTLGRVASSGSVIPGKLVFADGTTDNFGSTVDTNTLTANRSIHLPDEDGIVCLRNSTNCGFATTGGGGSFINNGTGVQFNANFNIQSTGAGAVGGAISGVALQTANLFELQDNVGNVNASFSSKGNILTLGRIANSGTVTQGKLLFSDGTTSNFGGTLQVGGTLTGDITYELPVNNTATQTICTTVASSCSSTYQAAGNYLLKNAQDSSTAAIVGYLLSFTNSNTGSSAGALALNNGGTASALSVVQSANPDPGQAIIVANNTAGSPSGNLLDLQTGGTSKFSVSAAGAATAIGVDSTTGLLQGTGGLTVTGAVSINTTGTANTAIGNATGTFSLDSNTVDISSAGAISGVTGYAQTSGNFSQSGGGTFGTGTGAVSLNGDTTIATGKNLTLTSGAGVLTQNFTATTGTAATFAATDSAASGTTTVQGVAINLTGTNNATGTNTITGLNFGNVTAATNNTFHGINFGTGFNSLLRYNGTTLISGTGILQNSALSTGVSYTNLTQVGALSSGSITSGFGTIDSGNTITGTVLNATTSINTGAGAGTARIDASGNLTNIGNITAAGTVTFSGLTTDGPLYVASGVVASEANLSVTRGGTGIGTTTAYGLITGGTTSTGAFQNAGTGSSGQILQSNGATALPVWVNATAANLCTDCIIQNPLTSARNTIAPTTNSVVALTVKGTTGTAAHVFDVYNSNATPTLQAYFDASGSLNVSQAIQPTANNTTDIGLSGTAFRTGYFGTSVLSPLFTGAAAVAVDTGGAQTLSLGTTNASAVSIGRTGQTTTVNGPLTAAELLTASAGLTVVGTTNINVTGTADTLIGNDTGVFTIQGAAGAGASQLIGSDGGFATTVEFAVPTGNHTITLPNETGTVCIRNSTACGFAPSATNGYVQLAPASAQADSTTNSSIFINKTGASGNILQLQKSGADKFLVTNGGNVGINTSGANLLSVNTLTTADGAAQAAISTDVNTNKGLVVQGVASQSADLIQAQDSTGTNLFRVEASGQIDGNALNIGAGTVSAKAVIKPGSAGVVGLAIQGATSQTADLFRLNDVNGAVLGKFDANSNLSTYGTNNNFFGLTTPAFTTSSTGTSFYYVITATNAQGETVASSSLGMANNTSGLAWNQVNGATGYKIYRNTSNSFSSGSLLLTTITNGTTVSYTDSGSATGAGLPPTAPTGNTVTVQGWGSQSAPSFRVINAAGSTTSGFSGSGRLFVVTGGSIDATTALAVGTNGTGNVGQIIRGAVGQTADLLQLEDNSGNINGAFNGAGNQITLGRIASSGTVTQGKLVLSDGTTDNFGTTLQSATLTVGSQVITIPDTAGVGGTICLQNSTACGFAPSATNGYVQLAPSSAQTDSTTNSSIFINKTGASGNILQLQNTGANKFLVTNAGNVGISATGANLLSVNNLTTADGTAQVAISTGATSSKGLVIQGVASQSASLLDVQTSAGSSLFSVSSGGDATASGSVIAGTALQGTLVKSADGAAASSAITFRSGNTTGGSGLTTGAVTIKSGDGSGTDTNTGNISIDAGAKSGTGTAGAISIGDTNASAITLGRSGLTTTAAGGLTVAANQNLTLANGTGVLGQTYTNTTGTAATFAITDSATSGTTTVQGVAINLTGTGTSGTNTVNGLNFGNVTPVASNTFNGIRFGTGFDSLLNYNGSVLIDGAGKLQNAAISSSVNYTNLTQVGTLTSGALGAGFTTVNVAQGGTGATTFTTNGVLYGNGTSAVGATAAGTTGQCLLGSTGNAPFWGTCATGSVTIQAAYDNSSTPELVLHNSQGALTVRDNSTPLGANLLEIQDNTGSVTYLAVDASGISVTGSIAATSTITGTTINGTTGINTGATGGTQRIDSSGNLVNIGTIAASGAVTAGTYNGQTISSTANFTGTVSIQGANALTLGTSSSNTGAIIFLGSGGTGTLKVSGPATPNAGNYTLSIPAITANANICTDNSICSGYAAAPVSGNYLQQVPTSNTPGAAGANVIAPTANSIVGLTVKGTTGTAARVLEIYNSNASPTLQAYFDANGSLNVSQLIQPTSNNAIDLGTSSVAFRTGYFGTSIVTPSVTTNGATALGIDTGAAAAITIGGNNANAITVGNTTTNPTVAFNGSGTFGTTTGAASLNGDTTVTGTKTFTVSGGLASLNAGLTAAGGTVNLNNNSNNNTNINTGTSTGTVGIGNSASGAITIQSGSTIAITTTNFNVSTAGVVTLAGGQTRDITTANASAATAIILQPGVSSAADGTGANTTIKAGEASSASCGTACTGGNLALQGGDATGGGATTNGGNVSIDAGTGTTSNGAINIGTNNSATINVGRTTGGAAINIGRSNGSYTLALAGTVPSSTNTQTVNIASSATGQSSASTINVNILSGAAGSSGTATLSLGNYDRVTQIDIGNVAADSARALNFGTGSNLVGIDTINIGTGNTTVAGGKTIHIGDGTPSGSGSNLVTIGSTALASATTIQAGTGNITLNSGGTIELQDNTNITGTLGVSGIITASALGSADTATTLCRNSSNQIATCSSTGAGAAFVQGGNSFGAAGDLGTNDNFALNFRTNNATRITLGTTGNLTWAAGSTGNFDHSSSTGTFATGSGNVSLNGDTTVTGTKTFTVSGGLASLNAGLTAAGGTVNLNNNSNNNTSINTGTSTGTVNIGNNAAGAIAIQSGSTIALTGTNFSVTTGGVANVSNGYQIAGAATAGNYLRGDGTSFVSSAIQSGDIPTCTGSCNYISNQTTQQSSSNFNISGTGIAGVALQSPSFQTADGATASSAVTFRSGNTTGGSGLSTGAVTIKSGDGSGTDTSSGNITIDTGSVTGTGTAGTITVGGTNASALTLGRAGVTTTAAGGLTVAANQNLTLSSGTGVLGQTYVNNTGTAATFAVTDSASSGTTTVQGVAINLTGTNNAGGTNTITGLNFGTVTPATNNTFNGISFGTGFASLLQYNGTSLISGGGKVQDVAIDSTVTYTNLQKVGTINTGTWQGSVVNVAYGGTGLASTTAYGLLAGGTTSTGAFQNVGTGTSGQILVSAGSSALPTWVNPTSAICTDCIIQNPLTTARNTIAPTAASVVALTVKGTTGTAARVIEIYDSTASPALQAYFDATGSLNVSQLIQPTSNNAVDLGTNSTAFRTGYFATSLVSPVLTTNGATALGIDTGAGAAINIAGANANAVNIGNGTSNPNIAFNGSGTFGTTTGAVSLNGNTTITGTKTFTVSGGLASLNAGLTALGAAIQLNVNSNNNTSINTGSSTGAVGIGNNAAGAVTIQSGSTIAIAGTNFSVTTGGVVNVTNGYQIGGAATLGNYLRGDGTSFVSSAIQSGDIPTCTGSCNYISNQTTQQSSSNFNISGTGVAGVALQSPSFQTADVTGASAATTLRSGNSTTSGNTGNVSIATGNATSGNSGNITIDSGTASGTTGTITIGGANTSNLILGRTGFTTNSAGSLAVAANQNLTLASGTGVLGQTYSNNTGTAATFAVTDNASSGTTTVQGVAINLTGTNNAGGTNTITGLNFGTVTAATNNTFNGISFGTGFASLLQYNGTSLISGGGKVQDAAIDSTVTYTNLQKVGTINTGTWQGSVVNVAYGGTGVASTTAYGLLAGGTTSTGAFQSVDTGTSGQVLVSAGASALPSWVNPTSAICTDCIIQNPLTTARNTIAPTAASVVALTVKGTTGTAARVIEIYDSTASPALQAYFDSAGSLNVSQLIQPTSNNAVDLGTSSASFRTGYFATSVVSPLHQTADVTGTSAGVTLRSGNSTSSGNTGSVTIASGAATSGNSGNISIDVGTASGTAGAITIGTTTATSVSIGRSSQNTLVNGTLTATQLLTANGGVTVGANQNLTLNSGTGTLGQTYVNNTGTAATFAVTDSASSGTTTVQGIAVNLTGTNNAGGANTVTGLNFGAVTPATNNTFNGITFGTGFNNLISYNGSSLINGSGKLQDAAIDSAVTYTNLQKIGTINTGTWQATTIGVQYGGTGQTTYTDGQLLIGNSTGNTLTKATLTGTANRLSVTNGGGSITLDVDATQFPSSTTNNTILKASGAGTASWVTNTQANICSDCATTTLNNLGTTSINASLLTGTATIDLGSNANPFRDLYLGGTATDNFKFTGTASGGAKTITLDNLSGNLALIQTAGGSTAQTGDLNVSGTLIAGTALQGTLVKSADTTGTSSAIVLRSGNSTSSGNTGSVTLSSGAATSGNSGNITIDAGTASGGTAGAITIAGTNASGLTLGRASFTTSNAGHLSIAANQNFTMQGGSGVMTQTYTSATDGNSGHVLGFTNSNSGATSTTISGISITPVGTTNGNSNANKLNAINLPNVTTVANNAFYGLNVGTGYNDILRYNGTPLISGLGKLQNAAIDSGVAYTNLTQVGTLTTGTWQASTIGVQYGGTGVTSTTAYGLLAGGITSTGAFQNVGTGTSGQILVSQGAGALPQWVNSGAGVCPDCLIQAPLTTAKNTIAPVTTGVVGLTVNGTSVGTAAQALIVNQSQGADAVNLNVTNGTQTNALLIDRSGSGTLSNGINITNTSGNITNGLLFSGTIGTDINRTSGVLSLQGTGGVTVTAGGSTALGLDTGGGGTVTLGNTGATTINIGGTSGSTVTIAGGNVGHTVNIGAGGTSTAQAVTIGSTGSSSSTTLQAGSGNVIFNVGGTVRATLDNANSFYFGNGVTAASPNNFTLRGTGSTTTAVAGGSLTIQGGNATVGDANGGNVILTGGTGFGTGVRGLVVVDTPTFTTASTQSCGSNCNVTQANIDSSGAVLISATAASLTVTLSDPTITTAGRIMYVTNVGSNDFTLSVNGGGTGNVIAMKPNTTATMIWNGSDWTAAGASSSTDLQSAYNNTLTSAGGAELVLNAPGGSADGLTIRNNATTPIVGGILEVQTSIGSNLLSVNNNATEYATNGGAETAGATSTDFPSNTWDTTTGGTITRYNSTVGGFDASYIATGQASVQMVTTTANHGARNRISTTLTNNLTYTVSFAVRGTTNFSTLDIRFSPDGTTTGTTQCATAQTVTAGIWSRITCSFVASGTITSSNSILIRQTDAIGRTFYIDNLSLTINASASYVADGSVDAALGSNWTQFDADGGAGTTTLTRDTTNIYDTSGAVSDVTTADNNLGMRNNLATTPQVSTQYLITFYAKLLSGTFNNITVGFLPAGGNSVPIAAQLCTDYNTQTLSTSGWTKITCLVNTPSSGISDPDIVIYQPTNVARTFYVDALTMTLNTNTASNVQVGGGNKGGPPTLFTLDRSNSAPIASNNDAYLGSMYYDTTSGRIQCYEADGWGACGAAPDNIVNLNPEYAGAVLNGTGTGTMSADFCSNDSDLPINTTLCGSGQAKNFYKWTSPQANMQTYSIYVTYQLPTTFNGFASDDTVQLVGRVDSTTNASVTYQMFKSTGSDVSLCGTETDVITGGGGSANTWYSYGINGNEATGCSFSSSSAGNFIIFKINVKAKSNATAYVSTLSFTTTGR